jgi:hypothetical protein
MASVILPPPRGAPLFAWGTVARQAAMLISRHGQQCVLRRASGDRWVRAFIRRFTQREMMGGLVDPLVRYALIAVPIIPPPDHQQDRLVTYVQPLGNPPVELEVLRILTNPERIEPAGTIAFWKLTVRR